MNPVRVSPVRVGIVGGGRIADLNAIGWIEHPGGEIAAICDIDEAVRTARAEEWGATPYAAFEEMLDDPDIDAIEILTPHHLHARQAIAALEAGKHLSLQKPPTLTLEEFDEVARVAEAAPGQFRVFENFAFYPPHVLARSLIDEGEIGDVMSVRVLTAGGQVGGGAGWEVNATTLAWRIDPALAGGGAFTFDHGYHCFHMARYFVDDPVECVHAFINFVDLGDGNMVDAPALISWRYAGVPRYGSWEVVNQYEMDVRSDYYVEDDRIEIRGSRGVIWVTQCTGQLLDEPPVVLYRDGEVRSFHRVETDWAASFRDATFDFIDGINAGRQSRLTPDDARATLALTLAAQRSAAEHREVDLAEM